MKLLPQYSIRLMLGITAALAAVFSVVGLAVRGQEWAIGVSMGMAGLAVAMVTYAVFFGILWVFSVVASPLLDRPIRAGHSTLTGTGSPFADPGRRRRLEEAIDAIVVDGPLAAGERDMDPVKGERPT
ncbi:MAG: hypothetical protein ACYC6Y_14290 [Thermoguttaceae bacterium]